MVDVKPDLFGMREIAEAVSGTVVGPGPGDVGVTGVCIDSRSCTDGTLFVPLAGERTDGHFFIRSAFDKGSVLSFVHRHFYNEHRAEFSGLEGKGKGLILVDDPLAALQALARHHLRKMDGLLTVGVTGSNGKTTTKELVGAILSRWKPTVVNPGNLNSDVGLPLAVFRVTREHRIAVFELGMNRRGEIAELSSIVRPMVAAVTNIGTAHIGLLGSAEGIAAEKRKIFEGMSSECTAIVPEDDDFRGFLTEGLDARVATFGPLSTKGFEGSRSLGLYGHSIRFRGTEFRFPLVGEVNLRNALCAMTIAAELGCPDAHVVDGLASASPLFGRGEVVNGPVTVIRDCYNANAESMARAIDFLDSLSWTGRKVLVAGPMKELGDRAAAAHEEIARRALASSADLVFLFGEEYAADVSDERTVVTGDYDTLRGLVSDAVEEGDLVLVKGSRAAALERLADILTAVPADEGS